MRIRSSSSPAPTRPSSCWSWSTWSRSPSCRPSASTTRSIGAIDLPPRRPGLAAVRAALRRAARCRHGSTRSHWDGHADEGRLAVADSRSGHAHWGSTAAGTVPDRGACGSRSGVSHPRDRCGQSGPALRRTLVRSDGKAGEPFRDVRRAHERGIGAPRELLRQRPAPLAGFTSNTPPVWFSRERLAARSSMRRPPCAVACQRCWAVRDLEPAARRRRPRAVLVMGRGRRPRPRPHLRPHPRIRAHALQRSSAERFAVLTGPPEMGKTAIARTPRARARRPRAGRCTPVHPARAGVGGGSIPIAPQLFVADDASG